MITSACSADPINDRSQPIYDNRSTCSRSPTTRFRRRNPSYGLSRSRSSSCRKRWNLGTSRGRAGSESSTVTQEVGVPAPNTSQVKGRIFQDWPEAVLIRYQEEFKLEEEHRQHRFNEAERARDYAETERHRLFRRQESIRAKRFEWMMGLQEQQYEAKERAQNAGEGWRKEQFEGGIERRSWLFEQAQAREKRRYSVTNAMEDELLKAMKKRIGELDKTHQKFFEQASERRSTAFTESQTLREIELGTADLGDAPPMGIPPDQSPSLCSVTTRPLTPLKALPLVIAYDSSDTYRLPRGRMRSRSLHRDQSRSYSSRRRRRRSPSQPGSIVS